LVYLQYISAQIHSKCASQLKIAKKSLKTHIFGVQGRSRSSMLVPLESSSAVLVMIPLIRRKSVSICNHSRARLVDSSRNRTFSRGYPNQTAEDTPAHQALRCHVDMTLGRFPDRSWRRRPGRPRNRWLDQLRGDNN